MQILFSVTESLNELCAWICSVAYQLIAKIYEIFFKIATVDILSEKDINSIYNRVTMILTIIMTFYIVFEMVKYVIEPDKINDKDSGAGKIATKLMIVVVLIAFVPKLFTMAFGFQKKILDNDIISKVVLGTTQTNVSVDKQGRIFSANILEVFYYVEPEAGIKDGKSENCDGMTCENIVRSNLTGLVEEGKIPYMTKGLTETADVITETDGESKEIEMYKIHFDGFIASAVGIFVVYILVLYCVDVGKRWAQIIFLQIIAPIPIIGYLSPKKDGVFQKWCKQCLTTFLDLFIRIGLIYFILVVCRMLTRSDLYKTATSGSVDGWVYIFIVLGLLMFAQNAPKLLQELFPSMGAASGNFGLKAGERVAPAAARAIGAGLGATALLKGAVGRGVNTARRNRENRDKIKDAKAALDDAKAGYKSARENSKNAKKNYQRIRRDKNISQEDKNKAYSSYKSATKVERMAKLNKDGKQAELKNKSYKSVAGNALAGAISGGIKGISAGAGATKLEDIGKKVKEGYKNEQSAIDAREKWLDAGGGSSIDRVLTGVAKSAGIMTDSNRIEAEVKQLEAQAKAQEALATIESDVKTKGDGAEDRLKDKIGELKLKPSDQAKISTGLKDSSGNEIYAEYNQGDTLAMIDRKYKSKAASAKSAADAATKRYQELQNKRNVSQTQLDNARKESERLSLEAQNAEFASTQVTKNAAREEFSQILRSSSPQTESNFDQVAVQKIMDAQKSVEVARSNPSTIEELRKIADDVNDSKFTMDDFNAFMTGNFKDFDQFDRVKVRLINISNERKRQVQIIKEEQRQIQASSSTDAAKANEGYFGGNK